jgi:hypothetical protein
MPTISSRAILADVSVPHGASTPQARQVAEEVYRGESRHVPAELIRLPGGFGPAEEAHHGALERRWS